MEEDGEQAILISADDPQAPVDPEHAAEQQLDQLFREKNPETFMRRNGMTLQQVRDFVKTRPAQRHAKVLDESSGQYPLHRFVGSHSFLFIDYGEGADDLSVAKAEWLGLVADLIRAFPQALLWQSNNYLSPLHFCASRAWGSEELCRLLVAFCPAACMIRDKEGNFPLQTSIKRQNWNVASILLDETIKCGVDLEQEKYPLIHLAIDQYIPREEFIKVIFREVPGSCRMKDEKGELPLTHAVRSGKIANPSVIRALIESYPEALRIPDEGGNLPLHIAPSSMCSDVDSTADYYASVKVLIDGYPEGLSTPNSKGLLPLHACISIATELEYIAEEMEVMRMVSECYPDAHRKLDKDGNLPLHFACVAHESPKLAIVSFIAEQNEQALRMANNQGCLPLHLAVRQFCCSDSVVRFLVEGFPEGVQTKNNQGELPLHVALSAGFSTTTANVVKFLVDTFPEGLQTPNAEGNLPLHVAMSQDLLHSEDLCEYLLDQFPGAARHANANGSLPIHLACSNNRASFSHIELLVKYSREGLAVFDGDGLLPFHRLCLRNRDGRLVQKMLQTWFRGQDLPWTKDNTPALFFACENHASRDVIKFFAEKSSDLFRTVASKVKNVSKTK